MASVVEIVNKALDKIGYGSITSLTQDNKAASLSNRTWPLVRDQVLRDHPWNFAIKRTTTAPDASAPSWGYTYQHTLPTDCLRVIELLDLDTDDYTIEGRKVLCDTDTLYVRYVYQVTDSTLYDALFVDAVSSMMAYEMCETLTQSNQKKQALYQMYQDALMRAKLVDAVENPPTLFREDSWVTARY